MQCCSHGISSGDWNVICLYSASLCIHLSYDPTDDAHVCLPSPSTIPWLYTWHKDWRCHLTVLSLRKYSTQVVLILAQSAEQWTFVRMLWINFNTEICQSRVQHMAKLLPPAWAVVASTSMMASCRPRRSHSALCKKKEKHWWLDCSSAQQCCHYVWIGLYWLFRHAGPILSDLGGQMDWLGQKYKARLNCWHWNSCTSQLITLVQ